MQILLLNMGSIDKEHYSLLDTCILENRYRYHVSSGRHRKQTIFAGDLLLRFALMREKCDVTNVKICYGINGKPYIENQEIYFNLSHSKNFVVLGIDKKELGIDILCERKINQNFIRFFYSKEEQRHLNYLVEEEKREYYWNALCYKEAYIKKSGGRIIDMKNRLICPRNIEYGKVIRVIEKGEEFESLFFKELTYHMCLISDKIPKEVKVETLNMDDIYNELNSIFSVI